MRESGWYPPGAEFDPSAPYNQQDPEPMEVDVTVSYTLSKDTTIESDQYVMEEDYDEDTGKKYHYPNFEGADLRQDYKDSCITLPELLNELIDLAQEQIDRGVSEKNEQYYKDIIEAASGWIVDEMEVNQ